MQEIMKEHFRIITAITFAIILSLPSVAQERHFGNGNTGSQGGSRSSNERRDPPPPQSGTPQMSGDMLVLRTRKAGEMRNLISGDARRQVRRLVVEGSINRDDLRIIDDICDRSTCRDSRGRTVENYLDLDLSRAQITYPKRDVLPEGIFSGNSHLRSIILPTYLVEIGQRAFSSCSKLDRVEMPGGLQQIDDYAFRNCTKLSSVRLPDRLDAIGTGAFSDCTSLSRVILPPGLRVIGSEAFMNCPITQIRFPLQLEFLGNNSFSGTQISELNIPRGTRIDGTPGNNQHLQAVNIEEGHSELSSEDGILYSNRGTTLVMVPGGLSGYIAIPEGVTSIGAYAFSHSRMSRIDIPSTVTLIGEGAFYGCTNILSLTIPYGVRNIPAHCFDECKQLQSVDLPRSLTTIGAYAFRECRQLSGISLPPSLTSIGKYAFQECNSIASLTVPGGVAELPEGCFRNCNGMSTARLSPGVRKIGEEAFRGCLALTEIQLPNTLVSIGDESFRSCSALQEIILPESLGEMGSKPFTKCELLHRVKCLSIIPPSGKSTGCEKALLIVPRGSISSYKKASGWKKHKQITEE